MQRREFITLFGGATVWSFAARAQRAGNRYTVGILSAGDDPAAHSTAFLDALRELGWVEGKNVVFEHRYAENRLERLPELAADLVRLKVDVIAAAVAYGTSPRGVAALFRSRKLRTKAPPSVK
jgi:putative ABC transport system substrate-binding protein